MEKAQKTDPVKGVLQTVLLLVLMTLSPLLASSQSTEDTFDFSLDLKPISGFKGSQMTLSQFENKHTLIYYFSVKCIHCQQTFPYIKKLDKEMRSQGVSVVAVSLESNMSSDIRRFIREYKCNLPVFQDVGRSFSRKYGTGSIPLAVAIRASGEYKVLEDPEREKTLDQLRAFFQ
jgi:peroxiredoxin